MQSMLWKYLQSKSKQLMHTAHVSIWNCYFQIYRLKWTLASVRNPFANPIVIHEISYRFDTVRYRIFHSLGSHIWIELCVPFAKKKASIHCESNFHYWNFAKKGTIRSRETRWDFLKQTNQWNTCEIRTTTNQNTVFIITWIASFAHVFLLYVFSNQNGIEEFWFYCAKLQNILFNVS